MQPYCGRTEEGSFIVIMEGIHFQLSRNAWFPWTLYYELLATTTTIAILIIININNE